MTGSPRKQRAKKRFLRDACILMLGIGVGSWIIKSGAIHLLLGGSANLPILASFVSGIFFTSIFTTAPAIAALFEITQGSPILLVAFFGACGAVLGDFFLFKFVHDDISADVAYLVGKGRFKRLFAIFHTRLFEWFFPFLGALVIASPLPDELGLALLGFSKIKTSQFILLSFTFNFLGIIMIGYLGHLL